jgi:L-ascorbate metabolism protein UlaG (beta-lactamase superfamily)
MNPMLTVTRITHSSVLLSFGDLRILTDPWFSERPGYFRGERLGMTIDTLPPLAAVLASHDHYDHFDLDAFQAYPDKRVPFVLRRGMGEKSRKAGFPNVTELEPWQSTNIGPVKITACPAKHSVPQNTYILEAYGFTVYFGGDTLLIPELDEIAERFPPIDLALLPVNGLRIRPLFNKKVVMSATDAAALCAVLRPRTAVPIHYAYTAGPLRDRFLLKYDGSPAEFTAATARLAPGTTVRTLAPGEPLTIDPRQGGATAAANT